MKPIRSTNQPAFAIWVLVALALFFVFAHIRLSQYGFDDAYIHFRAARNLLDLGTPYFNAQEAVKVSSSSGWTLFLAVVLGGLRLLTLENEFPRVVSLLNALISLGGMFVFTRIVDGLQLHPLKPAQRFFLQATYLSLIAVSSIGLMETPLAMLLAGVGVYNLLQSRPAGFVWLGIAAYFRLELMMAAVIWMGLFTLTGKFQLGKMMLLAGTGALPFLLYDLHFFQTILPHSIIAKSVVYSISGLHTFTRLIHLSFPLGLLNDQLLSFSIGLMMLVGSLFASGVTVWKGWNSTQSLWIAGFATWALVTAIGYISQQVLLFEWYLPLFTIPMFLAVTLCANQEAKDNKILRLLHSAFIVVYLWGWVQTVYASVADPGLYDQFEPGARVKSYQEVGQILYAAYPDAVLLSSEIGGLGYTFRGYVADAAGLASPEALAFHPMNVPEERASGDLGSVPPGYVAQIMPELIVSYDHFAQALLASEIAGQYNTVLIPAYPRQDARYARQETIWGDAFLRVYVRKDLPVSEKLIDLAAKQGRQ